MRPPRLIRIATTAVLLLGMAALAAESSAPLAGRQPITEDQPMPPWLPVPAAAQRDFDLGRALFESEWVPASHADRSRNRGLGPQFVQPSCETCHDDGGRGRPAPVQGGLSESLVMQLGGPSTGYGQVLNTRAIEGHVAEGDVQVTWRARNGRYADGQRWSMREPRYTLTDLSLGPLPRATVLKPRIAPALFGVGLIDAVPQAALQVLRTTQPRQRRGVEAGRFGWQGEALSLVDQTAIAFAREMGLTSELQPQDDCTAAQVACREALQAGSPELPERVFHAVNTFQFLLAAPARGPLDAATDQAGAALFSRTGCADCHVPALPVPRDQGDIRIDPYTDLLLHDLGEGLADRRLDGRTVRSRWRTAPLWGMAHALRAGPVALLHDGRAGSVEEAILWHEGEADASRRRFLALDSAQRRQLLDWVASL